jgi:hypothetical protein
MNKPIHMKLKTTLRLLLGCPIIALLATPALQAQTT